MPATEPDNEQRPLAPPEALGEVDGKHDSGDYTNAHRAPVHGQHYGG